MKSYKINPKSKESIQVYLLKLLKSQGNIYLKYDNVKTVNMKFTYDKYAKNSRIYYVYKTEIKNGKKLKQVLTYDFSNVFFIIPYLIRKEHYRITRKVRIDNKVDFKLLVKLNQLNKKWKNNTPSLKDLEGLLELV